LPDLQTSRRIGLLDLFFFDPFQILCLGNLTTLEHSQLQLFPLTFQVCPKQWPNDSTDYAYPAKALPVVITLEAHLPNIRYILLFTVLRANSVMNVVTEFMEEHVS
jgi:hypothetical protein